LFALGLAVTVATDAAAQQTTSQPPTRLPATRVVADTMNVVTVQNDRGVPVTIFLERGNVEGRLGVVPAGSVSTLPLPAWATGGRGTARLLARPEGEGFSVATPRFEIAGAARIGLLVPPAVRTASIDSVPVLLTAEEKAGTTVTVENPRGRPMTVYAEQGMRLVKLGEVPGKTQATLRLPADLVGRGTDIRIFVRAAGGAEVATRPLTLKPGDHISLDVVF
jgi:hypothetical protein